MQIMLPASMTCAFAASIRGPTATMAPSRTCTSALAKSPMFGSMLRRVAPRMTNSPRGGSAERGAAIDGGVDCWPKSSLAAVASALSAVIPPTTARRLMSLALIPTSLFWHGLSAIVLNIALALDLWPPLRAAARRIVMPERTECRQPMKGPRGSRQSVPRHGADDGRNGPHQSRGGPENSCR